MQHTLIGRIAWGVTACAASISVLAQMDSPSSMRGGGMMGGGMMGQQRPSTAPAPQATQPTTGPSGMMQMPPWMMGGMMGPDGMGGMMGSGGMGNMMRDMSAIHALLMNHQKIQRHVERLPNGIRSETTSSDPQIAQLIQKHVWQMKQRLENGEIIRMMDPLFRELFAHHEQIHLQVEDIPNGVRVTETSDDPQVQLLIRQHAEVFVSGVVESGMQRAMGPTPLPAGYTQASNQATPGCPCMGGGMMGGGMMGSAPATQPAVVH